MKFLALASLLSLTSATPLAFLKRAEAKSMMSSVPEWTIESMLRCCNEADTSCEWSFGINTNDGSASTPCTMTVSASGSTPASEADGGQVACGVFTVTSGWSGQFGEGNGFTVLSVVNYAKGLIVWPGYTDVQLDGGEVVEPDQSYQPQALP
ncbi:hypothetical protein MKZ38_005903 [Zalerion maritima]|uniref:Small secreted protein n=1 Tax=Zalerion maritima TaxID=339359 RepID=A0AAD5RPU6_9PEZI|nr:hypothetical protein MKZ38_005903 [Zalerion maritima]